MSDLWTAFVLGLVGGLHCVGMCGPLALALPVPLGGRVSFVAGRLLYNLGRVVTYALLGLVFGLVGRTLLLAGLQRWLSIGLGLALIVGWLTSRRLATSLPVAHVVDRLKSGMGGLLRQRSVASLAALGLLNGLLPCGLVYVALAGAVARGSQLDGILYMAVFGLGTLPMMLGISLSGRLFPLAFRLKLRRAIPVGICLLAGLLILRGMALGIPYVSPDLSSGTPGCCAHSPEP
jgi:sulfite exporter TauE/SafE